MTESGRGRRREELLLNLLIVLTLSVTAVIVFLALRSRDSSDRGGGDSPAPARVGEIGPGTYTDSHAKMKFNIPSEWEVVRENGQTRVRSVSGELPAYTMEARSVESIDLVANWSCLTLGALMPQVATAVAIWPAQVIYTDIPCAQDAGKPAYARVYYTLDDGSDRLAVAVLGPLDGLNWSVARSDPFSGEWSLPLIDAMTESVTTSRR